MIEILRSNDLVLLAYAAHLLDEAGIEHLTLDAHTSAVEGSIGILPRRLMVSVDDRMAAEQALKEIEATCR